MCVSMFLLVPFSVIFQAVLFLTDTTMYGDSLHIPLLAFPKLLGQPDVKI